MPKAEQSRMIEVVAIEWMDTCMYFDDCDGIPVPALTFGIQDHSVKGRGFTRVIGECYANGLTRSITAIPKGMSPRIVVVGKIPEPQSFRQYRKDMGVES